MRDTNPQRIADLSSPRDTLRSFLNLSREMIATWRAQGTTDRVYVLLKGLQETLDYSTTENGPAATEQLRRALLLREVLDRVALPPWSEIPGPEEAATGVKMWTIPGTRLRIGQIGEGSRAGEYVFTADTVADLQLTYSRVRRVPYQPRAVPILEEWAAKSAGTGAFAFADAQLQGRLSRIDTSSPRAVLTGFLRHTNNAYRIATDAQAQLTASPPTMTIEEARAAESTAKAYLLRASTAFDLSRVPASRQVDVRVEATLMLKEVLDRVSLPPIQEVPHASAVRRAGDENASFIWRFPGLPIQISRVLEGDRAGSFTFDPRTLEKLKETYLRVRDLPYRQRLALRGEWEYGGDSALSPGFYDFYISTPGSLVPSASPLSRFVLTLPDWTKTVRNGQTTWQWIGLVLSVVVAFAASAGVHRATSSLARRRSGPAAAWLRVLSPATMILVFRLTGLFVDQELNLTGVPLERFVILNELIVLAIIAWLIWKFAMAISATVAATDRGFDASLLSILLGVGAIVTAVAVAIYQLRDIGVDAVPLFAGLGVGGLAVALAIRPTLENLIGGLILHSDRPLRIGDFCNIGGTMGTIESIGVRSTKIRGLDRTLVSIPNARLSDMDIINWAHCDRMLITAVLGLRYETTPDQIRHVLATIRRMLHAHPKIDRDTVRVRYAGPAASSRDVDIRVYVLTHDWNEFHAVREDVFLRIDDLVEASGVGYAFPSQTLYMTRDQLPDAGRGAAAETEVAAWREAGDMPFPRFTQNTMDELEGTLDYPPKGSNRSMHGKKLEEEAAEPLSAGDEPLSTGDEPLSAGGEPLSAGDEPLSSGDDETTSRRQ
ncbi:MAG: mechanosensitive ion channel domain-containing protein [Anderseniella sp.]